MSNRFNPLPGVPYGECHDCELKLDTPELAKTHMRDSMAATESGTLASHSISVLNAPREDRIGYAVDSALDPRFRGLYDSFDEVFSWVTRGDCTREELEHAVRRSGVDLDIWQEWLGEEA